MERRIDEWESIVERLPPLDRAYQIDFRLLSDRLAEIPDDVNGILKLFDGHRTLAQVLEEADHGGLAAAKALARLWSEEIIRPAGPAHAAQASAMPEPRLGVGGKGETQGVTSEPEAAEWFNGPAEAERAPAPSGGENVSDASATDSCRSPIDEPRIVRFPAKRKDPQLSPSDMEAISSRSAGLIPRAEVERGISPARFSARRAASAAGPRRRSVAAALLLAGSVLAGVGIWKWMASRSDGPGDNRPTSTAPAEPSLPRAPASTAPAEPSQSRAPASGRAETRPEVSRDETRPGVHRDERGQGSSPSPTSTSTSGKND